MRSISLNSEDARLIRLGIKHQQFLPVKYVGTNFRKFRGNIVDVYFDDTISVSTFPSDHVWFTLKSVGSTPQQIFTPFPYKIGETVFVKESWNYGCIESSDGEHSSDSWFEEVDYCSNHLKDSDFLKSICSFFYKSDNFPYFKEIGIKWKSRGCMPKDATRMFLKIISIDVCRLQSISTSQLSSQGYTKKIIENFPSFWNNNLDPVNRLNYGFEENPFVWVIDFETVNISEGNHLLGV